MSPATQATPLVAALGQLGPHDHFCSIYESPQEHYAVAIAFIRIGLDRGEKCIYIADDGTVGYVRQVMQSEGIDVDRATTSKALVLATKEQAYLEHGSFNPDWMFTFWEKATQLAMSEGFSALRVTGETEWVLRGGRGLERWMEYESRLTHALSESNCCALCQYNRRLFPSELILDVIRTHPVVIYHGTVCRNLYYVPPDEFLGTNQTEREVERLLTNIREREQVEDALREQITERKHAEEERQAHLWFLESMDQINRAIQASNDLEQLMSDVLASVLTMFACDRAWLVYPCDPQAAAWQVAMEHTRPHYSGALGLGPVPMDEDGVKLFQTVRAASGPVQFGAGSEHPLPAAAARQFSLQSMLAMALHPKGDRPYLFGLHQCASARVWTPQEQRLFQEIGRRLSDALTSLLMLRSLRQSEAYLAEAQRLSHTASWAWKVATREFVHWSQEHYRMYGLDPQRGIPSWEATQQYIHPEDRAAILETIERAIRERAGCELSYRAVLADGTIKYIHSIGHPVFNASGELVEFVGTEMDITARKRTEDELRTQKEILQKLFDHTPMMIGIISGDGQWQMINRAWERTFGWALEELQQPDFNVLAEIYPDPREYQRVLDFIVAKSGKWEEFTARARDGRVLDAMFTNVYLSDGTTLGFGLDITERKRAEEALRERASLLDLTHDTVFVRDMHDVISYWNRGAEELYGWSSKQAIGQVIHQLTQTIFPAPLEAINEELLRTGRWEGELVHSRRDGIRVVVASRWALQLDESGNPLAILETNNNITERKRVEEELRTHREQLEELVAERTHELSTLLETSNTIASTLELQLLLRVVLEQLKVVVKYTGATIFFLEGEDLVVLGHSGPLSAEQVAQLRLPAAQAVGYQAVRRRGGPLIIDDVQSNSPEARAYRELAQPTLYAIFAYARSLLLVPLIVRERLIGLVRIDSDQPHFYTEHDAQLALAFANQAAAAIENARLYDQARDLATIEERQRLARELHDAVTQTLFSASLIAEALPEAWQQSPAKAQRGVEELRRLTRGALAEMRTLLLELRPGALAEKPLGELLGALCTSVTSRTRIPIELDVEGDALLAPDIQIALYRVTQEALNNIAKHAAASQVTITFQCNPEQVALRITDDGRGFDPSALAPGSLGLGIMRERAASIGATLRVESRPEAGTEVHLIWQNMPAQRAYGGTA